MKTFRAALLLLTALALAPARVGTATAVPIVDPILSQVLSTAGAQEQVQAIVTFNTKPTTLALNLLRLSGVRIKPLQVLPMVAIQGTPLQIAAATSLGVPGVVSIYFNRELEYFLDESTATIGATAVWNDLGFTGEGVTVAVLDSGIDGTHPDLVYGSKVAQNVKMVPDPFSITGPVGIENLAPTDTTSGHGTHCASTVAGTGDAASGRYRGVAPGARLVGIGSGEAIAILTAVESFDWLLANRTKYDTRVVSNSWGTTGAFDPADPVNVASKAAHDAGITVVFAAGNEGPGDNTLNPYSVAPWVIGVAAGTKDGQSLADFSSRGVAGDPVYQPTITAPGVDIVAARAITGGITVLGAQSDLELGADAVRYTTMSGTSMATPHVAGVVALMLQANPSLTPDQIRETIRTTARPMAGYQVHQVGAGYVDALAAVNSVR